MTTFVKDGATFELSDDERTLTVWLTSEKYWATWKEYRKTPGDETDEFDRKIAGSCLKMIADEALKLTHEGKKFELRLATVHLGAEAAIYAQKA